MTWDKGVRIEETQVVWVYPVRCYEDPPVVPEWVVETEDGRIYDARAIGAGDYEFIELQWEQLEQQIPPPAGPRPDGCPLRELIVGGAIASQGTPPSVEAMRIEKAWHSQFGA